MSPAANEPLPAGRRAFTDSGSSGPTPPAVSCQSGRQAMKDFAEAFSFCAIFKIFSLKAELAGCFVDLVASSRWYSLYN